MQTKWCNIPKVTLSFPWILLFGNKLQVLSVTQGLSWFERKTSRAYMYMHQLSSILTISIARLSRSKRLLYGASLFVKSASTMCTTAYKDLWPTSIAVLELSSHLVVWIGSHQPTILCSCHTFLGNSLGQVPQLSPARKYHKMFKSNSSKYKDTCQDAHIFTWFAFLTLNLLSYLRVATCLSLAPFSSSVHPSVHLFCDLNMCHSTRHTCNNLRSKVDKSLPAIFLRIM